jgi:hypothetical protein
MCILFSTVIYVAVGYHVFHQRNQLRNLTLSNQARDIYDVELRDSEKVRSSCFSFLPFDRVCPRGEAFHSHVASIRTHEDPR